MPQPATYCTECGEPNPPGTAYCMRCGTRLQPTRRQQVTGVAFVLNELQVPPFTEALSVEQRDQLHGEYAARLRSIFGPARPPEPIAPGAEPAPTAAVAASAPQPAQRRRVQLAPAPVRVPPAPREPYDWSWLAEQQANLFLFAGAFLTVIAALIYVGYSGQAVSGALKMTLLSIYTVAFLTGGAVCLRIPRVTMAGQVFFAIGAILVPLNFVAAHTIFAGENLNPETLWLAGSIVTAAFYTAVAYTGISRGYAFGAGVALVSGTAAATEALDVAPEWRPACFIVLAILMALPDIAGNDSLRRRIGSIWSAQAQFVAIAGIAWAAGLVPFAADRPDEYQFHATTLWFLPISFALLLAYAAIPMLSRRRQDAAIVSIGAFAGVWISVVYALDLRADYYVLAIAGLAPVMGLAMAAISEPASKRLPDSFAQMLRAAAIIATLVSALGALIVANSSIDRTNFGAAQRWSLTPAFALILAFYLLDAFTSKRREGAPAAALSLAGVCAAIVFGLDASVEYYAFAFIAPAIALAALVRWAPQATFGQLSPEWREDVRFVGGGLAVAGIAVALLAAVAAVTPDATYQPDYRAYLPVAFAAAAVFFVVEASRPGVQSEWESPLLSAALLTSLGAIVVSLPFVFDADPAWYGAALALAAVAIGYGGRAWSPSWLDARARDAVAIAGITTAWLPFEGAYADAPRLGAAVHLAAAAFYATAAVLDRSSRTLNELMEIKGGTQVRAAVGWLYASALTAVIGYVYLLRSLPAGDEATSAWFALPLMAAALAFAALAASSRWWRQEFRAHLYIISLATAIASIAAADSAGTLTILVTVYAVAYTKCAVWEDAPVLSAPAAVFTFAAVPAWRVQLDAPLSVIPIAYCAIGLVLAAATAGATTAAAQRVRRWQLPLLGASATFVVAAPIVGFGILANYTHHGVMDGVRFERTALYQWSTLTVAIAGAIGLVASALYQRRWGIVPATAVLTVAFLLEIGHFHPENPQWYTAVIGAYLLALGILGLWKFRLIPAWTEAAPWIEALGAAVIMTPSALEALQGEWRYLLVLLVEATSFFAAGITLRRRGILGAGALFLVGVAGRSLFDAVNALPNWIVVMIAGMALLGIGMGILLGRERWDQWERTLLGWWATTGDHPPVA